MEESKFTPTIEAQMLIRKPVAEVFQAFIDPAITTNFWFTKSSGALAIGETVTWEWEMYNVSTEVQVDEIITNELISIRWGDPATTVDFQFKEMAADQTYLIIKNYGFAETGNELIQAIMNNTGGFTTVVDGAKAYLEHGIRLNLVSDKFPQISQK